MSTFREIKPETIGDNVIKLIGKEQRYTFPLMEAGAYYTLSFSDEHYREALNFCGTQSGRDVDKVAATGLTPVKGVTGAVYFAEARLVLECHKVYAQNLKEENFVAPEMIDKYYAARDFHRMYIGEIVRCQIQD